MREKKKNRDILSSTFVRIVAFFVLTISFIVGVGDTILTVMLWEEDVYTNGGGQAIHDIMRNNVWEDVSYVKELYSQGDMEGMKTYLGSRNISMEIISTHEYEEEEGVLLWSDYDGTDRRFTYNCFTEMYVKKDIVPEDAIDPKVSYEQDEAIGFAESVENSENVDWTKVLEEEPIAAYEWKPMLFRVYVDDTFPVEDEYKMIYDWGMSLLEWVNVIPVAAVVGTFIFLCSFIYLMCSAGHHRGQEGISGGVLYYFHFDIITVIFGTIALVVWIFIIEIAESMGGILELVFLLILSAVEIIWCTIYCMEFATELKRRTLFKHTILYSILRFCVKWMKRICAGVVSLLKGIPLVAGVLIAYVGYSFFQLMVMAFLLRVWYLEISDAIVLWFIEKVVLLPVVLYFALVCKRLQEASESLAEGNLLYKLDTSKMLWGFKEHGENLNRIGDGIAAAVDERMKSEHLKTELITNVSHDIKTPLTSIINYADLIGTAVSGNIAEADLLSGNGDMAQEVNRQQLAEYSEVLLRQSKRLKKLLEDLLEASKATTGNLEVDLTPCEISVILSQAVGEYEQRFEEKGLNLIVRQPEEPVSIMADGRHLWRVFDNLLNNICKYAQENSRVYLTVESGVAAEQGGKWVEIIFRNMSKYALEVSAEELQERFVRGDKSRHMEGNGLGLSIAGSLVDLQNGKMKIVTDGDLFKVILRFPEL